MIKRQFYSLEHRSRDAQSFSSDSDESDASSLPAQSADASPPNVPSSSSRSSSPDSEGEEEVECPEEAHSLHYSDTDDAVKQPLGGERRNSSASLSNQWADLVDETLAGNSDDEYVIRCKGVLKCRICPTTLCLSTQTMQAHLKSKKHARSSKLMREGRLKVMLNSDGEAEEQGETHAERYARTIASVEQIKAEGNAKRKKGSGRQRQHKRAKRKAMLATKTEESIVKHGHTTSEPSTKTKRDRKFSSKKSRTRQAEAAS